MNALENSTNYDSISQTQKKTNVRRSTEKLPGKVLAPKILKPSNFITDFVPLVYQQLDMFKPAIWIIISNSVHQILPGTRFSGHELLRVMFVKVTSAINIRQRLITKHNF